MGNQQLAELGSKKGVVDYQLLSNGIGVLRLGPPSEATIVLTPDRMDSLKALLDQIEESKPTGLIIAGSNAKMFTVGADVNIINSMTDRQEAVKHSSFGQAIVSQLASLSIPTVALIEGPCVGGGCEIALACDYRLMSNDESSRIGLPEIKLGIIPGFGGTQRLPRLIGLPKALDIILNGRLLRPSQALSKGLVNEVMPAKDLMDRAELIILGKAKCRKANLNLVDKFLTFTAIGRNLVQRKAVAKVKHKTKGFYPAPTKAVEVIVEGLSNGIKEGLKREAEALGDTLVTPEAKALVSVFIKSEEAKAIGRAAKDAVHHWQTLVLGAGVMGSGIAQALAQHRCQVILKDQSEDALAKSKNQIETNLNKLKYLNKTDLSFILNRIEATTKDSTNTGNVNMVIEAVPEDLQLKQQVLSEAAHLVPDDTLLATNTSSLSVSAISEKLNRPERVVGLHFFNPVTRMPLVEIIRGEKTSDNALVVAAAVVNKLGKYPVIVNDVPGFLVNRMLAIYLIEASRLLIEGYSAEDIEQAALNFGLPMGPFRVLDEIGLEVAARVLKSLQKAYGKRLEAPELVEALISNGRSGRHSGTGFYRYEGEEPKLDTEIYELLKLAKPSKVVDSDLSERLVLSLVQEAFRCFSEGVAGQPSQEAAAQIDIASIMGFGFPPFRGGVLYYANACGLSNINKRLVNLEKQYGERFKPVKGIV